jgi:hypothetical protein
MTESKRLQLHLTLKKVLGDDMAETLMDHLPPTGWASVARRDDVERLERQLDRQFAAVERRMGVAIGVATAVAMALLAIQVQIMLTIAG